MADCKICSKCNQAKNPDTDFYWCAGKLRSECKKCTIRRNIRYQKQTEAWKHRFVDGDVRRSYMAEYYANNKEKFDEYRKKFRERNPDYYREYFRRRKEK